MFARYSYLFLLFPHESRTCDYVFCVMYSYTCAADLANSDPKMPKGRRVTLINPIATQFFDISVNLLNHIYRQAALV